jgi:hypothetical protein
MDFKLIPCFVNIASANPDAYDGVYYDPNDAACDRMEGFVTVQAYIVGKEFMDSIRPRLDRIADQVERMAGERDALEESVRSMHEHASTLANLLHRCVEHLSDSPCPDLQLERDIRVALGLSTQGVDDVINMFKEG